MWGMGAIDLVKLHSFSLERKWHVSFFSTLPLGFYWKDVDHLNILCDFFDKNFVQLLEID